MLILNNYIYLEDAQDVQMFHGCKYEVLVSTKEWNECSELLDKTKVIVIKNNIRWYRVSIEEGLHNIKKSQLCPIIRNGQIKNVYFDLFLLCRENIREYDKVWEQLNQTSLL